MKMLTLLRVFGKVNILPMIKLKKENLLIYLITGVVILLLIALLVSCLQKNELIINISVGLLGVFLMLGIALHTFLKMDESTKETVKTILTSSEKQIKELINLIEEFKKTNLTLTNVSSALETVASDVVAQQKQIPNLTVAFGGNNNQIRVNVGHEVLIKILFINSGQRTAEKSKLSIYFPPQIEILDAEKSPWPQGPDSPYAGYTTVDIAEETLFSKKHIAREIKIKIKEGNIQLFKIPFECNCINAPQTGGNLLIDAIG